MVENILLKSIYFSSHKGKQTQAFARYCIYKHTGALKCKKYCIATVAYHSFKMQCTGSQ